MVNCKIMTALDDHGSSWLCGTASEKTLLGLNRLLLPGGVVVLLLHCMAPHWLTIALGYNS